MCTGWDWMLKKWAKKAPIGMGWSVEPWTSSLVLSKYKIWHLEKFHWMWRQSRGQEWKPKKCLRIQVWVGLRWVRALNLGMERESSSLVFSYRRITNNLIQRLRKGGGGGRLVARREGNSYCTLDENIPESNELRNILANPLCLKYNICKQKWL